MGRQMFLHELITRKIETRRTGLLELRVLNWNIRNPSLERAKEQAKWIMKSDANVIILTEAKYSGGCVYIKEWLQSFGFDIFLPKPGLNDYCVMVGAKGFDCSAVDIKLDFLPHRAIAIICETGACMIKILGIYVPSRGPVDKRNVDKMEFQKQIMDLLGELSDSRADKYLIVGGDLNVVERGHVPHYSVFGEWEYEFYESFLKCGLADAFRSLHLNRKEYSWFGKKGDGYRFDHFFVSKALLPHVTECSYIHTPRTSNISDHSSMYLRLGLMISGSIRHEKR